MRSITRMRTILCLVAVLAAAAPSAAQYQKYTASTRATGETWNVEFGVGVWQPPPDIVVSSKSLGIIGSEIRADTDLGMESSVQTAFTVTLRPAKKHKFRFAYSPIWYSADTILQRTIVFNGQAFQVSLPISSSIRWTGYRFGYEYRLPLSRPVVRRPAFSMRSTPTSRSR